MQMKPRAQRIEILRMWALGVSVLFFGCGLTAPANATVSPDPATITYKSGDNFLPTPLEEMYVLRGTTVTFKAMGAAQQWGGQPIPLEKNWAITGEGVTLLWATPDHTMQIKFDEVSNDITDFKTVTVKSDDIGDQGRIIKVVVYDLIPVMTPDDNFEGRSETDVGIGETGTFSYTTSPLNQFGAPLDASDLGGLKWSRVSGDFTVDPDFGGGTATWVVGTTEEELTSQILIQNGASKNMTVKAKQKSKSPVAHMIQKPGTTLRHTKNFAGIGFKAYIYLLPYNVSYKNLQFREGECFAEADGFYAGSNGAKHSQSESWLSILANNRVNATDTVNAGDKAPPFAEGRFVWHIPWKLQLHIPGLTDIVFPDLTIANHIKSSDDEGTTSIRKVNTPTFTKAANAESSGYNDP